MNVPEKNERERADRVTVPGPARAARRAPARKDTGWLKTLLATSGVALTIIGSGLIAQRDASSATAAAASPATTTTLMLEPVPTAAAHSAATGATLDAGRAAGLRFPGAMTLSRSSR